MFIQSRNPVYSRAILDALLGALDTVPAAALLVTPFVHLFTAGPSPITPDSVPADFTEATFTGYAADALALPLLGPITADSLHQGVHQEVDFLAGAVTPPGQVILGYWIDEAATAGTDFYMGEIFEVPIPIAALGNYISLDVVFPLTNAPSISPS